MKGHHVLVSMGITVALAATVIAQSNSSTPLAEWNFDKDEVGKSPPAWRVAETKASGKTGKWTVVADETAPSKPHVLKLDTKADDSTYNLLIAEKSSFKDVDVRANIKALSGNVDQGGGLIWRARRSQTASASPVVVGSAEGERPLLLLASTFRLLRAPWNDRIRRPSCTRGVHAP